MTYIETKDVKINGKDLELYVYKGSSMNFGICETVFSVFLDDKWISSNKNKTLAIKEAKEYLKRKKV